METKLTELIFVVEQAPEGGYTASALGADIITEADSLEELRHNVREATEVHFDEGQQPKIIRLHFVREEVLALTPA
jgi:predicted RNase H-like HicB family nuclease